MQYVNGAAPAVNRREPSLTIEYATTADMDDGQPLPPFIEGGIPWRVVMRAGGHTTWCRNAQPHSKTRKEKSCLDTI
jgi:hypothetical protein